MTADRTRQPKGIPTGGQFAASGREEARGMSVEEIQAALDAAPDTDSNAGYDDIPLDHPFTQDLENAVETGTVPAPGDVEEGEEVPGSGGHAVVVTTTDRIEGTCTLCRETRSVPNKGLGRATIGAWKTQHQHGAESPRT